MTQTIPADLDMDRYTQSEKNTVILSTVKSITNNISDPSYAKLFA